MTNHDVLYDCRLQLFDLAARTTVRHAWGDEIDHFNLVAARSESAATRMVLRFRIVDEGDQRWFDHRRKAGKWQVTCYGNVPTLQGSSGSNLAWIHRLA